MNTKKSIIDELSPLGRVFANAPLKDYTSFKTGGPAEILIYPESTSSIPSILEFAHKSNLPITVIGAGTNLLVGDRGIDGLVIRISDEEIASALVEVRENEKIYADASIQKDDFIEFAINHGFGGLDFMAGIPGSLGGGIAMNAGTNLGCFIDIIEEVHFITEDGVAKSLRSADVSTAYRTFTVGEHAIITGALYKLPVCSDPDAEIKGVKQLISERWKKHPMNYPSAGSVFKNPQGHSSWKLVDDSGLKGKRIGGAMVSEKHTNFIINADNATSQDIRTLIEHVQATVYEKYTVRLETEVRMIGNF